MLFGGVLGIVESFAWGLAGLVFVLGVGFYFVAVFEEVVFLLTGLLFKRRLGTQTLAAAISLKLGKLCFGVE
jgi:hypothetical protein